MNCDRRFYCLVIAAMVYLSALTEANGGTVPVTNWARLVGTSTVTNGGTNSPTFSPADAIQVAGGFDTINLADGDFIRGDVTVTLDRTGTGGMSDNVRFALFREAGGGNPTAGDGLGYTGISFALQGPLRGHRNPARAEPFSSGGTGAPTNIISPAGVDPEADTVTADLVTMQIAMIITRDGNNLDIVGSMTDGGNYTQSFSVDNFVPDTSFTTDVYSWNRMAFLFGGSVNGESAAIVNARVRSNLIIPEPATAMLMLVAIAGWTAVRRNRTR